ncbi:hemerythrin domain-containing protein [Oxalobacteraceae bacterium OM1]|nr:hemerythrin domain-containing protein [Oxalobacteraceae bacterium OM1]
MPPYDRATASGKHGVRHCDSGQRNSSRFAKLLADIIQLRQKGNAVEIDETSRRRGDFPTEQPLQALRDDHALLRRQFDRYFAVQDKADKQDAGTHIVQLLQMHAALEEGAFYPRVRSVDPGLIAHGLEEHEKARHLVALLEPMDKAGTDAARLMRELADTMLDHIEEEEGQLFPKIEQSQIDMSALGHEMQALELQLVAAHAQKLVAPGLRV